MTDDTTAADPSQQSATTAPATNADQQTLAQQAAAAVDESGRGMLPSQNPQVRADVANIEQGLMYNDSAAQIQADLAALNAAEAQPAPPPPPASQVSTDSLSGDKSAALDKAVLVALFESAGVRPGNMEAALSIPTSSELFVAQQQQQGASLPSMG